MQHSFEQLDRPGGFSGRHLFVPLKHRDFRVLWLGMAVSLVGDGMFLVAVAWESYSLWNAPVALSLVGIAMTVPMVAFLLVGGVVSDRYNRRVVMLWSDALRATAVAILAVLALAGAIRFWELVLLVGVYGAGGAFFTPAFEAIVPELVPTADLAAANSLDQFIRPIALRLAGPALGGALAAWGIGVAFAVDAASFAGSLVAVLLVRRSPPMSPALEVSAVSALKEGLRFVRSRIWIWGTLVSAAVAYLVFLGPTEVLLPFVVKNDLHASAETLGIVLAAGGLGAVAAAIFMGRHGHPRRDVTAMYVVWMLATLAVAGYGVATAAWQLMIACFVFNALEAAGTIVWATIKQRNVPAAMLGRVSSLDWLVSIALLPLSFALTAPIAALIGARVTLIGAALVGGAVTIGALFLPGMREIEGGFERDRDAPALPGAPRPQRSAAQ